MFQSNSQKLSIFLYKSISCFIKQNRFHFYKKKTNKQSNSLEVRSFTLVSTVLYQGNILERPTIPLLNNIFTLPCNIDKLCFP